MAYASPQKQHRALVAVGAQFWINGMVYASIIPRLPEISAQIGASKSTLGLALTLASIGGLLGSAGSSRLIGRFGSRSVILAGTAVMLVCLSLVSTTGSVLALAVILGLVAFTDVGVDIGMNLQGSWLSTKRKVPVMNRLHGLWSLGTVVGGLIAAQATASQVSLRLHLGAVATGLAAIGIVVGFHLLGSDDFPGDREIEPDTSDIASTPNSSALVLARSSGNKVALVLAVLGAAAVAMEMTTTDWASFRLGDDLAVAPGRVGLGFVAFTIGMVVGRFAGDTIEARLGTRQLVRYGAVLAGVGISVAVLVPADWFGPAIELAITLIAYFIAALGVSVIFPQLYDAAAKAPGPPGRALGAMTAGTRLATFATPVLVGVLADSNLTVGVAVAIVTLPACTVIYLLRTDPSQLPGPDSVSER